MNQLNQKNQFIEKYTVLFADILAVIIAYLLALLTRFGSIDASMTSLHFGVCVSFVLVTVIQSFIVVSEASFTIRGYLVEFGVILKNNLIMIVVVATLLFITQRAGFFSRMVWGYVFLYNLTLEFIMHVILKHILKKYMLSEHSKIKIMIITEGKYLQGLLKNLADKLPVNYDVEQVVLLNTTSEKEVTYREKVIEPFVMEDKEDFIKSIINVPLDEVFFHVPLDKLNELQEVIQNLEAMGVVCHCNIDLKYWRAKESFIGKFADYTVVSYSMAPMDYRGRLMKRIMDIIGGLIGLLILLLLMPFVALAIKIDSRGPIFFSQIRIGKNGRRFRLYKFRSMYVDAEAKKEQLMNQNEMSGFMFKLKDDPRVTPVGKFLRKTSIDELPQFYNILRGDMSLVGTRPPTQDEFEQYSPYYRRRLCITPGLTGLWQVSGRSDITDFDEVVKMDLEYIDNWSIALDIKILFKTIAVVLLGKGAN